MSIKHVNKPVVAFFVFTAVAFKLLLPPLISIADPVHWCMLHRQLPQYVRWR
jgi:hypothetical protein